MKINMGAFATGVMPGSPLRRPGATAGTAAGRYAGAGPSKPYKCANGPILLSAYWAVTVA
ncbi:hypothetical protein [Spirosoma areae]